MKVEIMDLENGKVLPQMEYENPMFVKLTTSDGNRRIEIRWEEDHFVVNSGGGALSIRPRVANQVWLNVVNF